MQVLTSKEAKAMAEQAREMNEEAIDRGDFIEAEHAAAKARAWDRIIRKTERLEALVATGKDRLARAAKALDEAMTTDGYSSYLNMASELVSAIRSCIEPTELIEIVRLSQELEEMVEAIYS